MSGIDDNGSIECLNEVREELESLNGVSVCRFNLV